MPDNTDAQPIIPELLEDIVGTQLTIRQAQDKIKAAENLNAELSHVTGASPLRDLAFIKVPTLLIYFTPSKVAALAT